MGSCYSDDHIAGDHIHMNVTTCNIEEPQQKPALERSVIHIDYWGGVWSLHVLLDLKPRPLLLQWFQT